jgi:hypothetical protein
MFIFFYALTKRLFWLSTLCDLNTLKVVGRLFYRHSVSHFSGCQQKLSVTVNISRKL